VVDIKKGNLVNSCVRHDCYILVTAWMSGSVEASRKFWSNNYYLEIANKIIRMNKACAELLDSFIERKEY